MYKIRIENTSKDFLIKTPEALDIPNAKVEIIEQTPTKIHTRNTFANGFVYESVLTEDGCEVTANCPIVFDGSTGFHFDFSKIEK